MATTPWMWAQTGLLGATLLALLFTTSRIGSLEERLDALETPGTEASQQAAHSPKAARPGTPTGRLAPVDRPGQRAVAGALGSAASAVKSKTAPELEEHLWTEDGRAAIADVVEERSYEERQRRSERWEQMAAYHTQRTVDEVADTLDLDASTTEQVQQMLSDYQTARSDRWRKMHHEEDVDPVALHEEGERERENFERELTEVLGTDGFAVLEETMNRGHRM
jgi:hypothetical protein